MHAMISKFIDQRLLQPKSDHALAHRHTGIKRQCRRLVGIECLFVEYDIADLWTVTMYDHELVPLSNQGYETASGGIGDVLLSDRRCFTLSLQRIPTERDDNSFAVSH
jgi:hypothetical protein